MDFLSGLSIWGGGWTGSIIPFLLVLTIVVFFHELGHFLIARWCGVRVLVFSVGFGPELLGFNDRPRHALEDLGNSARRLRQVLRRRERRERAGSGGDRSDDRRRASA